MRESLLVPSGIKCELQVKQHGRLSDCTDLQTVGKLSLYTRSEIKILIIPTIEIIF